MNIYIYIVSCKPIFHHRRVGWSHDSQRPKSEVIHAEILYLLGNLMFIDEYRSYVAYRQVFAYYRGQNYFEIHRRKGQTEKRIRNNCVLEGKKIKDELLHIL
jgi:hypothetical protein